MKALCCAAMVALFVGGCILIPCGYECESEGIVAKREGESGQTQSKRANKLQNCLVAVFRGMPTEIANRRSKQ